MSDHVDTLTFDELRVEVRRLKDQLAEADANGLRLAEENEKHKDALVGLNDDFNEQVFARKRAEAEAERLRDYQTEKYDEVIDAKLELETEVERLRAALDIAKQHIKFNRWMDDPGSDRRYDAVKELEALEGSASDLRG